MFKILNYKDRDIQKRGKKQLRCFQKNVNVLPEDGKLLLSELQCKHIEKNQDLSVRRYGRRRGEQTRTPTR